MHINRISEFKDILYKRIMIIDRTHLENVAALEAISKAVMALTALETVPKDMYEEG